MVPPLEQLLESVKWLETQEFLHGQLARQLPQLWRVLLTTDGSTTTFLQACSTHPIAVEVAEQHTAPLPATLSGWFDTAPKEPFLWRRVWLKDGDRRVVLGYSLIARNCLSEEVRQLLHRQEQPLGLLAGELGLPSLRDQLQIGQFEDPALSDEFQDAPSAAGKGHGSTPLWCRRYRLIIPNQLTSVIVEVFSPTLERGLSP